MTHGDRLRLHADGQEATTQGGKQETDSKQNLDDEFLKASLQIGARSPLDAESLCETVSARSRYCHFPVIELAARRLAPGVYIVIHGQVFHADRAMKDRDLGTFVAKS